MSNVAVLLVVVAMVFCANAGPVPDYDPGSFFTSFGLPNPWAPFSNMGGVFAGGSSGVYNAMTSSGGGVSAISTNTGGGQGTHQAWILNSETQDGKKTKGFLITDINGKVEKKVW